MGILFAFISASSFAMNNIVVNRGFLYSGKRNNGFLLTVVVNVLILGIAFFVHAMMNQSPFPSISGKALIFFMLAGLCTTGLGRLMLFSSIQRIGANRAAAIRNAVPLFTILFAVIVLGEKITWIPSIGVTLILLGIFLQGYLFLKNSDQVSANEQHLQWIGYILGVGSAFIFGIGQGVRKQGLLHLDDAFLGAWIGSITSLVFAVLYEAMGGKLKFTWKENFSSLNPYYIVAGILTSIGPLTFFIAVTYIPVSYVSAIAAVEPLITVLISGLFLKEKIYLSTWITVALILCGTLILTIYG